MKNVIKEIFIMLLLCVAIALILAVVFYDYNPINKEVPEPITYQMPAGLSDIKEELDTPLGNDDEQVIRTYELTDEELDRYENINYDAGKVNPFELYTDENSNTVGNTISNTITNNKTNTSSTGTFFENKTTIK